jgi:hypothetical protein
MVPSSGISTCTLFTAGPWLSSVGWSSSLFAAGCKKAEDQATELNQGPAVNSVQAEFPEDATMGCRNVQEEERNEWKLVKEVHLVGFLH